MSFQIQTAYDLTINHLKVDSGCYNISKPFNYYCLVQFSQVCICTTTTHTVAKAGRSNHFIH